MLASLAGPGPWAQHGACRTVATEVFFPGRGASTEPAKTVCRSCVVRDHCREYALGIKGLKGVWGGLAEAERERLRAGRAPAPQAPSGDRPPRQPRRSPLYRALEELSASPGRWARVAWYPGLHSAAGIATRLRAGALATPEGPWQFDAMPSDGGSELRALYGSASSEPRPLGDRSSLSTYSVGANPTSLVKALLPAARFLLA